MEDISLHVLDIMENALRAGAKKISVRVARDPARDELRVIVSDDGRGMSEDEIRAALDPFYTTKENKRIGLGLPLLGQAAGAAGGRMELRSRPEAGTTVTAVFGLSHPDCKPLGDMEGTMKMIKAFHRDVDFEYESTEPSDTVGGESK